MTELLLQIDRGPDGDAKECGNCPAVQDEQPCCSFGMEEMYRDSKNYWGFRRGPACLASEQEAANLRARQIGPELQDVLTRWGAVDPGDYWCDAVIAALAADGTKLSPGLGGIPA